MNSQFSREGGNQPWTSDMAVVSEDLRLVDFFVRVPQGQWSSEGHWNRSRSYTDDVEPDAAASTYACL